MSAWFLTPRELLVSMMLRLGILATFGITANPSQLPKADSSDITTNVCLLQFQTMIRNVCSLQDLITLSASISTHPTVFFQTTAHTRTLSLASDRHQMEPKWCQSRLTKPWASGI